MSILITTINGPQHLTGGENNCSYAQRYTVIHSCDEGEIGVLSGNGKSLQDAIDELMEWS